MARLDAKTRAKLPDSCFAYIDSAGRRRLPINDAAHVRNALSRFNQVDFEDEAARDRARLRLLRAAQKHGVVPLGFISGQLQPRLRLPSGHVTFLLTDIERSTDLLHRLGDDYARVASRVRTLIRRATRACAGHEVDARGDEFFGVFRDAPAALAAALATQRALRDEPWTHGGPVRIRIALHSGRPSLTDTGYVGLAVHAAARFCYCAHGGQIVLSSSARAAIGETDVRLRTLGRWRFQGLREPEELFQVEVDDLPFDFPPLRSGDPA
jgi:class 3 adenylate cyclase